MMSLWDALRMNMMISYQELVRTFHKNISDAAYAVVQENICLLKKVTHSLNYPQKLFFLRRLMLPF
ncbi:hypothetical protein EFK62_26025 [Escherichia coli]|nr:hypothetical protein [Escherichia coli]